MKQIVLILLIAATGLSAQTWEREGSVKRWSGGASITSPYVGCATIFGDPTVQTDKGLEEVSLETGTSTLETFPEEDRWYFLPRQPRVGARVLSGASGATTTTVFIRDIWKNVARTEFEIPAGTSRLMLDVTDTWVAEDGSEGVIVFSPGPLTPEGEEEYVFAFYNGSTVTFTQRVKPKVDVDIYVRPTDDGPIVYLRGNGISFPPSEEEVFTNASYLMYSADGSIEQLRLDQRGPGSGKGRQIIWHSNKWDRLVLIDEFASGAMLVKASNGIFVDSITGSQVNPGSTVRILSASGNNRDTWMATHADVGGKKALILWAMPDVREVTSVSFGSNDNATKQMPLSDWDIIIPYISSSGNSHTLYYWDPEDVVSVEEQGDDPTSVKLYPNPASEILHLALDRGQGPQPYVIVDAMGGEALRGTTSGSIDVSPLPAGVYTLLGGHGTIRTPFSVVR